MNWPPHEILLNYVDEYDKTGKSLACPLSAFPSTS